MNQTVSRLVRLGRSATVTGSLQATGRFLRRQLWAWPVIAAVVLGSIGWWVSHSVETEMHRQAAETLVATLNADVTALRTWMAQQEANAQVLAASEVIGEPIRGLLQIDTNAGTARALLEAPQQSFLRQFFAPRLKMLGYSDFILVSPKLTLLAAGQDAAVGLHLEGHQGQFCSAVLAGRPTVSRPFRSRLLLPDDHGEVRAGVPTMFTAAPVLGADGKPFAALGLRIRPEGKFTEILQVARFGQTGETYAFDRTGLLLSQSRFDDELRQLGLLADQTDAKSILTVEVRDPGVDMHAGKRPTLKRSAQPLTRLAADAVAGGSGVDTDGYRDYRGVKSVGAWAWLPEYDFGVATEVDAGEAFRALAVLRVAFRVLIGLLVVSAVAIFAFMVVVARQRLAVQRAVLEARQLGQYALEKKIGAGGMGAVYRARHAMLRRPTAVKLLEPDKVSDIAIARFEREVQLTSQLTHPNTVAIYDYGRTPEGVFYYAMEYLDGIDLDNLITRYGPQPEGRVVSILRQACGSLAEAHALGLVHRDVKPANMILTHRGGVPDFVKVLDFGLARAVGADAEGKVTAAGSVTGTPLFMAPEAIERPDTVDARSDLYALGAVGYYLLTGTPVFRGETLVEICMQHVRATPEPPSRRLGRPIAAGLEAVILRCLAKDPTARFAGAGALLDELERCAVMPWTPADAEAWWTKFRGVPPPSTAGVPSTVEAPLVGHTVAYAGDTG